MIFIDVFLPDVATKITKNLNAIWLVLAVEMHVAGPGVCMYHYHKFLMG